MPLILFNLQWMVFNAFLALIPIYAGWLMVYSKRWYVKVLFGSVWFFFLPNTLYILTDLIHLPIHFSQMHTVYEKTLLLAQYGIFELIGLISFFLALQPVEYLLSKQSRKKRTTDSTLFFVLLNFLIAFGVVLGRVQRINSWDMIIGIEKVFIAVIKTLSSFELLLLLGIFSVISNVIYFSLRIYSSKFLSRNYLYKRKR